MALPSVRRPYYDHIGPTFQRPSLSACEEVLDFGVQVRLSASSSAPVVWRGVLLPTATDSARCAAVCPPLWPFPLQQKPCMVPGCASSGLLLYPSPKAAVRTQHRAVCPLQCLPSSSRCHTSCRKAVCRAPSAAGAARCLAAPALLQAVCLACHAAHGRATHMLLPSREPGSPLWPASAPASSRNKNLCLCLKRGCRPYGAGSCARPMLVHTDFGPGDWSECSRAAPAWGLSHGVAAVALDLEAPSTQPAFIKTVPVKASLAVPACRTAQNTVQVFAKPPPARPVATYVG